MILSEWLKDRKVTRRDFAARIGVTPIMVTYYCSGKTWPDRDTMKKITAETDGIVTANDFVELQAAG